MKKTLVMVLALVPCFTTIQGQNAGQIIASQYGEFKVTGSSSGGFSFPPATCQVSAGGRNFAAFSTGTPIKIVDSNPNLTEVATPSSVYIGACSVNMATVYNHVPPFYLTSGTGGLQEAITANQTNNGPNTIVLDAEWYRADCPWKCGQHHRFRSRHPRSWTGRHHHHALHVVPVERIAVHGGGRRRRVRATITRERQAP